MFDQAQALPVIVERVSQGEPLEQVCRTPGLPRTRTVHEWMQKSEHVSAALAHARELGHDAIAADCITIADSCPVDQAEVAKARLRVETRLKLLACWNPGKYGAKVQSQVDMTLRVSIDDPTRNARATAKLIK